MCSFRPGDEIVCIASDWYTYGEDAALSFPEVNKTYTVESVFSDWEGVWVSLCEIPDEMYAPEKFRKVERKSDSLSIEAFLTIKPNQFEEPRRTNQPAKRKEQA